MIVLKPPDTNALYGSTVLLTCIAVGDPTPSIVWLRDGSLIENSTDVVVYQDLVEEAGIIFSRSILEVCSLDLSDEATYTCIANSSAGEDTASFSLDVTTEGTLDGPLSVSVVTEGLSAKACDCGLGSHKNKIKNENNTCLSPSGEVSHYEQNLWLCDVSAAFGCTASSVDVYIYIPSWPIMMKVCIRSLLFYSCFKAT